MTNESDIENGHSQLSKVAVKKEKSPYSPREKVLALGVVFLGLSSLMAWRVGDSGKNALIDQRNSARAESQTNEQKAIVAMWAAQRGITQIIDIDAEDTNPPSVELSLDPSNPKACHPWFQFDGNALKLTQLDNLGKIYDTVDVASGSRAQAVLEDICPPVKP